ncbi:MAG: hypothetical protein PHG02_01315, partial [Oscillospiraceae bacterium]|nr:hypothetical protein [Oscillospiraceae bacterium]
MGAFISVILALAALCCYCLFFTKIFGVNSARTPFLVLCGTIFWLSLWGCFNLLLAGTAFYFLGAAVAAGYVLYTAKKTPPALGAKASPSFISPGMLFFLAFSIFITLLLALQNPLFTEWDEFSFWGTAAKVVKQQNTLYSIIPSGLTNRSYPPGLIVLTYLFEFFAPAFTEWIMFAAYDILFFAVFAAAVSCFKNARWQTAFLAFAALCATPFFFDVVNREATLIRTYMIAYADMPCAILFGGALALYFSTQKPNHRTVLGVALAFAVLALVKDIALALALIAMVIILADMLFFHLKEITFLRLKGIWAWVCSAVVMLLAPVLTYLGWGRHLAFYQGVSNLETGGSNNMSLFGMVIQGVKEILGFDRTPRLQAVLNSMIDAFFTRKVCMIGTGVTVVVLILCIVLAAALLSQNRRYRIRCFWFGLTGTCGFGAYYLFHTITYTYVLKGEEGLQLASYNRYIYTYYLGWLIG